MLPRADGAAVGPPITAARPAPPSPPPKPASPARPEGAPQQPTTFRGVVAQQRNAILTGAAAYRAAGPSVSVHDAVVRTVAPIIAKAAQEQDTAQQHLDADKSNGKPSRAAPFLTIRSARSAISSGIQEGSGKTTRSMQR